MSSRKLTRSIIVAGAAIAIGAGSYGVVSATTGSGSSTAGSGSPTASSGSAWRSRIQCPERSGAGRIGWHGQQHVRVGLHADDSRGPEGDH